VNAWPHANKRATARRCVANRRNAHERAAIRAVAEQRARSRPAVHVGQEQHVAAFAKRRRKRSAFEQACDRPTTGRWVPARAMHAGSPTAATADRDRTQAVPLCDDNRLVARIACNATDERDAATARACGGMRQR
jgi:hypothetical protein